MVFHMCEDILSSTTSPDIGACPATLQPLIGPLLQGGVERVFYWWNGPFRGFVGEFSVTCHSLDQTLW